MFVNTGRTTQMNLFRGNVPASEKNCEFTAAAGAVNLASAQRVTSGQAADFSTMPDTVASGSWKEQAVRIQKYVTSRTGRQGIYSSRDRQEVPYAKLKDFMLKTKRGTVFAVLISGPTLYDSQYRYVAHRRCHWLNAFKKADDITFFDFQTNREYVGGTISGRNQDSLQPVGGLNPSSCSSPFIGIEIQTFGPNPAFSREEQNQASRALHSNDHVLQKGMFDLEKATGFAIAFQP